MELTAEPPKPTFVEVFQASGWTRRELATIASRAKVHSSTLTALFIGNPVPRDQAASVLKVLAQRARRSDWTLDTVDIPVEGSKA